MKSIIASTFAAALLFATAASAQVGVGVHVGGAHVGVGIHSHTYHRPYHAAASHCWWRNHHRYCH